MICRVRRVWPSETHVTVILVEDGQMGETKAFLRLPEQQLQAALCERVERKFAQPTAPRFVVQLAPPDNGSHHIELLQMIHERPAPQVEADAILSDAYPSDTYPDADDLYPAPAQAEWSSGSYPRPIRAWRR